MNKFNIPEKILNRYHENPRGKSTSHRRKTLLMLS